MTTQERELSKLIIAYGYKMNLDDIGIHFTGTNKKYSFVKTGSIYNCYENKLVDGKYELKDSFYSQIMLSNCLYWVLNKVSKRDEDDNE